MGKTAFDSPALIEQSMSYPARYEGRVPRRVRMLETVRPDVPLSKILPALRGAEYEVWVNRNGAVSAFTAEGEDLGLRPGEFEVIEWHGEEEKGKATAEAAESGAEAKRMTLERAGKIVGEWNSRRRSRRRIETQR